MSLNSSHAGRALDRNDDVVRFLAAVIMEACRSADLVADLIAARKKTPVKRPKASSVSYWNGQLPPAAVLDRLRDLGALLRIAQWQRSGLSNDRPAIAAPLNSTGEQRPGDIANHQLATWLKHFAWDAPVFLGADVLVSAGIDDDEQLLDRLAEFLWRNRQMEPEALPQNQRGKTR